MLSKSVDNTGCCKGERRQWRNSEPKQGQRSQSARGFCPRSTMRVPQPDIIEHFGNADAVPQLPERCLSRKAGIVRCCLCFFRTIQPSMAPRASSAVRRAGRRAGPVRWKHLPGKACTAAKRCAADAADHPLLAHGHGDERGIVPCGLGCWAVASSRRAVSAGVWGITASLAISAPRRTISVRC